MIWQKVFGGEEYANEKSKDLPYNVFEVQDGYVVSGFSMIVEKTFITKVDKTGNIVWWKFFNVEKYDMKGYTVKKTPDSGFIGCGLAQDENYNHYPFVMKLDEKGEQVWLKEYKEYVSGIGSSEWSPYTIEISGNEYWVLLQSGWNKHILMKIDKDGNKLFANEAKATLFDNEGLGGAGHKFKATSDGGSILYGDSEIRSGMGESKDIRVVKFDKNAKITWNKTFGKQGIEDWVMDVCETGDGGFIIAGGTGALSFDKTKYYFIKTNKNGDITWEKISDLGMPEKIYEINDGYMIGGQDSKSDIELLRTDRNGNVVWKKVYKGSQGGTSDITPTSDGGTVSVAQCVQYGAVQEDILIIKTDDKGNTGSLPKRQIWKKK
ncbi:MAG: hypothetical protein HY958_08270 [Bacteroidia bacterium]|nr:hypothetical protein [Bacteroidia bacterium]